MRFCAHRDPNLRSMRGLKRFRTEVSEVCEEQGTRVESRHVPIWEKHPFVLVSRYSRR